MLRSFWKVIIWALFILLISAAPGSSIDKISFWEVLFLDKIIHLIIYYILTILLINGIREYNLNLSKKIIVIISVATGILYGGLIELLQKYIFVERSAEILDFIANSTGAIIAGITNNFTNKIITGLISFIMQRKKKNFQ